MKLVSQMNTLKEKNKLAKQHLHFKVRTWQISAADHIKSRQQWPEVRVSPWCERGSWNKFQTSFLVKGLLGRPLALSLCVLCPMGLEPNCRKKKNCFFHVISLGLLIQIPWKLSHCSIISMIVPIMACEVLVLHAARGKTCWILHTLHAHEIFPPLLDDGDFASNIKFGQDWCH